jgi:hypothetical protein
LRATSLVCIVRNHTCTRHMRRLTRVHAPHHNKCHARTKTHKHQQRYSPESQSRPGREAINGTAGCLSFQQPFPPQPRLVAMHSSNKATPHNLCDFNLQPSSHRYARPRNGAQGTARAQRPRGRTLSIASEPGVISQGGRTLSTNEVHARARQSTLPAIGAFQRLAHSLTSSAEPLCPIQPALVRTATARA